MKSLERRFNNILQLNPCWSSYICFTEAIKGQEFGKQAIHRWFSRLVEKDDYARSDKREILAYLGNLTKPLRTTKNRDK